jgi:hypothetical protein
MRISVSSSSSAAKGSRVHCKQDKVVPVFNIGARGSVVVKALCYKPEGHGFDTR